MRSNAVLALALLLGVTGCKTHAWIASQVSKMAPENVGALAVHEGLACPEGVRVIALVVANDRNPVADEGRLREALADHARRIGCTDMFAITIEPKNDPQAYAVCGVRE
jgi:hypothetical protein